MSSDSCPPRDKLITYVRGTLSEDLAEHIEEHLDTCPECETTVEELERGSDSLADSLRRPVAQDEYQRESQCQQAVAMAEAIADSSCDPVAPSAQGPIQEHSDLGSIREYQLLEKLGEGGMGTVYKAHHTKLKRVVALKVLPPQRTQDDRAVARFEREMEAVGKLDHPNIVRALDAGEFEGKHYLVMEYIEGADLSKLVQRCGPLPVADACEIARQAALGLQYAHDRGLVHRDIKPSNVMVATSGQLSAVSDGEAAPQSAIASRQAAMVKVLDLGLALLRPEQVEGTQELTTNGQMMGTADYMAPEQTADSHRVDIRADIYSLGCTLYKLLSGYAPFGGPGYHGAMKKMMAHVVEEIPPIRERRDEVPEELAAILDWMLAKEPSERFSSPSGVAAALEPFTAGCDLAALLAKVGLKPSETVKPGKPATGTQKSVMSAVPDTRRRAPAEPQSAPATFRMRPRWVAIAAAVAGIVLLGFILTITGRHGTLVVETEDESVEVVVKRGGEEVEIIDADSNWTIRLKEGEYDVQLRGGDDRVQVDQDTVTVRRGEKTRVKVVAKRAEAPSVPPGAAASSQAKDTAERLSGWKPGKPVPRPKCVPIEIEFEPLDLKPGGPLSETALVSEPAPIEGVRSWSIETRGHRAGAATAWNSDGSLLATFSDDGAIRLWNPVTGGLVKTLLGHDLQVWCAAWSPDGKFLASGGWDGTIRFWDVGSGSVLRTIKARPSRAYEGHSAPVLSLAWSPDGRLLASGCADGSIQLWDVSSGEVFSHTFDAHADSNVRHLTWSPDGERLASWGEDGTVKVWVVGSADCQLGHTWQAKCSSLAALDWSPDGRVLATSGGQSYGLWNTESGKPWEPFRPFGKWTANDGFHRFAWSPLGETAVTVYGRDLKHREIETGEMLYEELLPELVGLSGSGCTVRHLSCSPGGDLLALSYWESGEGLVELRDAISGSRLHLLPRCRVECCLYPSHPTRSVPPCFSSEGDALASAHLDGTVQLWETSSGKPLRALEIDAGLSDMAFSPDRDILAIGIRGPKNSRLQVWDIRSGELRREIPTGPRGLAWSPDGKSLAVTGVYGAPVQIYDAESATLRKTLSIDVGIPFGPVAWSPDGQSLAAALSATPGGENICVLDVESGRLRCKLSGKGTPYKLRWHDETTLLSYESQCDSARDPRLACTFDVKSAKLLSAVPDSVVALSPVGELRVAAQDGMIRLERADDGKVINTIVPLRDLQYVAISPDGHYRGSPGVGKELVYVVQTDKGQETLTPDEFSERHGWSNDPNRVKVDLGDSSAPKPR